MKIFLFGSIASGKTDIANRIIEQHENMEYIAIDDFRRKYGDGSMENELVARKKFINSIQPNKNQIVEASGLGVLGHEIAQAAFAMAEAMIVVILYIDEGLIAKRLINRQWDIPFPGGKSKLETIIANINKGIKSGEIFLQWNKKQCVHVVKANNQTIRDKVYIISIIEDFIKVYQDDSKRNN